MATENHFEETSVVHEERLEKIADHLERVHFGAYVELMQKPWRIIWTSALSGVFRGLGIGLGFTIIAGSCVLLLQQLEVLNLPVVGKYIADLVGIVQAQLHTRQHTY